jgi:hypothetical protein
MLLVRRPKATFTKMLSIRPARRQIKHAREPLKLRCHNSIVIIDAIHISTTMKTILNIKRYINARKMTLFYATALVIGVFGTAAPSKAGSITAFNYLYGLYKWWSIGSTHNYYQVIKVRVTFQGGERYSRRRQRRIHGHIPGRC